jgi:Protein of unknown function (DUF4235)
MTKVLYKLTGLLFTVVGGTVAKAVFQKTWRLAVHDDEAPEPTDARRGWREVVIAAALQGALVAVVHAVLHRATAEGTRKLTGTWPGEGAREES